MQWKLFILTRNFGASSRRGGRTGYRDLQWRHEHDWFCKPLWPLRPGLDLGDGQCSGFFPPYVTCLLRTSCRREKEVWNRAGPRGPGRAARRGRSRAGGPGTQVLLVLHDSRPVFICEMMVMMRMVMVVVMTSIYKHFLHARWCSICQDTMNPSNLHNTLMM